MSKVLVTEQYLSDIGSAIRAKAGTSEAFRPAQMASAIEGIKAGGQENEIIDGTIRSYENSEVTSLRTYAFYRCTSLTTVNFLNVTNIGSYAFQYCSLLTTASFPTATNIETYAFRNCYNLLSLYLLGSSITALVAPNAFGSTPISNYTTSTGGVYGSIYVPASLYNSYKTATNWTTYSSRFVSV